MKNVFGILAAVLATAGFCGNALAAGGLNPVPEPGSLALVGLAVAGLVAVSRRNK